MILWFAKCLLNTHHVPDSVLGAHGTVARRTPFVEHCRYGYRRDEWVKFVLCCSMKFGRLQSRQGLGTPCHAGWFREGFLHWEKAPGQRRNPVGRKWAGSGSRDLRSQAQQVCLNRRERLETGVEWAEGECRQMYVHACKQWLHLVLLLMRWKGTGGFQRERRAVPALWGCCHLNALGSVRAFTEESRVFQSRGHQQKWGGVGRASRDGIVTGQCGTVQVRKAAGVSSLPGQGSWWARSDGT